MNLAQMKSMVFSITDYNPDVQTYQDEVRRIINEVYDDFFSSRPWTFSQKEIDIYTQADITVDDAFITTTSPQSNQSHYIENVGAIANDTRNEGSILQISGATTPTDDGEYFIDSCDDLTHLYVSKKAIYQSSAFVTTTTPVTVTSKQRYITLPPDCVEPMGVTVRDPTVTTGPGPFGPITELSRRDDAEMALWIDQVGTPRSWVPYDNAPGGELDVSDFPPMPGDLTVTNIACPAGEAWPPGEYTFSLAYRFRGHIGPIGAPVTITIPTGLFSFKPRFATRDTTVSGMHGLHKHIFFNIVNITSNGYSDEFVRDMNAYSMATGPVPTAPGTGTIVGTQFYIPDVNVSIDSPPDYLGGVNSSNQALRTVPRAPDFTEGTYWRIRLHPRPAYYMPIRVRYIRRSNTLIADTDTPESPPDTHRYIVYRACEELFTKHNALPQAQLYKQKADNEEKHLAMRWLTQRAANYVKKGFRVGGVGYKPFRRLVQLP
jgi:hypothetical protein